MVKKTYQPGDLVFARVKGAYWICSNSPFIQYCDSNIGLFSIVPPLVIALPTIAKLSLLLALKSDSEE